MLRVQTCLQALMLGTLTVLTVISLVGVSPVGAIAPAIPNPTLWSAYGPREQNLVFTVYGGAPATLAAFSAGLVDLADVPDPGAGPCLAGPPNPDYVCVTSGPSLYPALAGWDCSGTTPGSLGCGLGPARSSLVSVQATGFAGCSPLTGGLATGCGFWSLLNMQQKPGSQTICPGPPGCTTAAANLPGGGNPSLIRRSTTTGAGGLVELNPFTSAASGEIEILSTIFDSMLKANPDDASPIPQHIEWMTTSHTSNFNPVTMQNTQVFNLRRDICWHDSTINPGSGAPCDHPVTSDDVCFTIGVQQAGPGVNAASVANVISCATPNPQTAIIVRAEAVFNPSDELNTGLLPIVPAHVWQAACGWVAAVHSFPPIPLPVVGAPCVGAAFDPMLTPPACGAACPNVNAMEVGSGPYRCVVPLGLHAGKIGGSCTESPPGVLAGQAVAVGGEVLLQQWSWYMRCCDPSQGRLPYATQLSPLQMVSWADTNKDGKVTIVDAASAAIKFALNDKYIDHPLYGIAISTVDIGEMSFLAANFDSGTTAPCINLTCPGPPTEPTPAGPLVGADSIVDPYRADLGGGITMYYMGLSFKTVGPGAPCPVPCLELASIGTVNPPPGAFTANVDGGFMIVASALDANHAATNTIVNPLSPAGGNINFAFPGLLPGSHTIVVTFGATVIFTITTT